MTQHSSPRMTPHPRPGMTAYLGDTTQMITKTTSISTPTISDENNNGTFGVKRTLSGKCSEASESQSNMKKTRTDTEASTTSGSQVETTVHMSSISSQSCYRKLEKKIADLEKETHKLKKRVKDLEQRASTSSCVESTPADTIEDQDKQLKALLALVAHLPSNTERDTNIIIRRLSLHVFSKDELVTCTRTGKKTVKAGEAPKPALNSQKMELLEKAVFTKCPQMMLDAFRKKFDNVLKMERRIK
ncbi:uncharacterized protein LOC127868737 [Dreissena polymorpha]|uniref:uncharacterized protein LOC127864729 n=1 Tax=Dreissena polymorpha TaxID=45954 RepID=UPI0022653983|nr:uncharacterized protein LOC127864729 [Dreissena polymorpha]XP_052266730.1 uncharacterized protein LOC127868737 [Dreissena polymorpha]